ncbi:hypothetical protein K438DRAFT_1578962 [Mycena galopus ATCC 62051]|nr:hypothetical protein K438DRAFT_1578962 [Mycena galopus ATCC 62051]
MSAAFAFVPRKVVKSSKSPLKKATPSSASTDEVVAVAKGKGRELPVKVSSETATKPQYSDEDFTILLCLSLSKHRLWSDPDLRRNIEWSSRARANDGCVSTVFPLSYLLEYSCPLSSARASETVVVKALRAHAADVVDVRMAIPSGEDHVGRKRGNFEIRPKFWDDAVYPVSREGWGNRTVYVENIPIKYKTLAAFFRFLVALLPANSATADHNRIQEISLPPHHSDEPGTEPKLKSFALVTFATTEDAESLLSTWSWARTQTRTLSEASSVASEAIQFGFRTLSKARWDELNAEYLNYRTTLLADIPAVENVDVPAPPPLQDKPELKPRALPVEVAPVGNMSYPQSCLVFVRNIHPETNKTTLRNFFAKAVDVNEAIDYVDFNKGMDSCYLRLTTAAHAKQLVEHFTQKPTIHANGLDDSGCRSNGNGTAKPVDTELVLGKKEEVYWEKVPTKVCLQAVQKALGLGGAPVDSFGGGESRRQRKKQKR